jgi:hypothetical protein
MECCTLLTGREQVIEEYSITSQKSLNFVNDEKVYDRINVECGVKRMFLLWFTTDIYRREEGSVSVFHL